MTDSLRSLTNTVKPRHTDTEGCGRRGRLGSVCISNKQGVARIIEFRENIRAFFFQGQSELSVIMTRIKRVFVKLGLTVPLDLPRL